MAYGTTSGRKNALQLLLYYWPSDLPDYPQSDYGYPFRGGKVLVLVVVWCVSSSFLVLPNREGNPQM